MPNDNLHSSSSIWPSYPTGGGYWCQKCGRFVGQFQYHSCGFQRMPASSPSTTTFVTRPAEPDARLKFALELIEAASDLEAAKKIARAALGDA